MDISKIKNMTDEDIEKFASDMQYFVDRDCIELHKILENKKKEEK